MPIAVSVLVPIILGVVLLSSGALKLRHPEELASWERLGVPRPLRHAALVRAHPWGELGLGAALIVLGGWLGVFAALAVLGLMVAYTWLIWLAWRRPEPSQCACFGAESEVTGLTVLRNLWLACLAAVAVVVAWAASGVSTLGLLVSAGGDAVLWVLMAVAAALTTWLLLSDSAPSAQEPSISQLGDVVEEPDYLRARTPAVPVTLADGSTATLRELSSQRALLLLAVSETCGSCVPVIEQIPKWRELLPELAVRVIVGTAPGDSGLTSLEEPLSLHDTQQYARQSLGYWGTPSAVLLGADGMLAGGPVSGEPAISEFIADVYLQLHAEEDAEAVQ